MTNDNEQNEFDELMNSTGNLNSLEPGLNAETKDCEGPMQVPPSIISFDADDPEQNIPGYMVPPSIANNKEQNISEGSFLLPYGESLNLEGLDPIKRALFIAYADRFISASMDVPEPEYLLQAKDEEGHDIKYMSMDNIHLLSSKQKQGKTMAGMIMMSQVLGSGFGGAKALKEDATILYIDTEQASYDTVKGLRYVNILCGLEPTAENPRIHTERLRGVKLEDMFPLLEIDVELLKPSFVFVDGIKDFISDINDQKQATETVQKLLNLVETRHCAILFVLHENLKSEDKNARGAIGTECENKLTCWFRMERGGDCYKIINDELSRTLNIAPLYFRRDRNQEGARNGIPIPITANVFDESGEKKKATDKEKRMSNVAKDIREFIRGHLEPTRDEILKYLKSKAHPDSLSKDTLKSMEENSEDLKTKKVEGKRAKVYYLDE